MNRKIEELSAEEIRLLEIWLAENLMGWELRTVPVNKNFLDSEIKTWDFWYEGNECVDEKYHFITSWNPTGNMNHVMMCADKCDFYPCISKTPMGWAVFGRDKDKVRVCDDVSEIPLALCITIKEGVEK